MNRLAERLEPLIDAEQRSPGPAPEVVAVCWDRIAAAVQAGDFPTLDVPPPARPRGPYVWIVAMLLGASLVGGLAYATRGTPPATSITAEAPLPAPVVASPPRPSPAPAIVPAAPTPAPATIVPEAPGEPTPPVLKAVVPRPRQRPAGTTEDADTFAAELRLLAAGQAALSRDDHEGALRIADEYQRTYPRGHFIEDRDALRVVTLCSAASPLAAAAARRFLRTYPNSIHAIRVRDECDSPAAAPARPSP